MEEIITVAEAAELSGYSTTWVYCWIDRGMIPAYRFGKLRLVRKAGFVEWLATYTPKSGPRSKISTQS